MNDAGQTILRLRSELKAAKQERNNYRSAHKSVVNQKRELNEKYAAIMRRKPRARLKRLGRRIRRLTGRL